MAQIHFSVIYFHILASQHPNIKNVCEYFLGYPEHCIELYMLKHLILTPAHFLMQQPLVLPVIVWTSGKSSLLTSG